MEKAYLPASNFDANNYAVSFGMEEMEKLVGAGNENYNKASIKGER